MLPGRVLFRGRNFVRKLYVRDGLSAHEIGRRPGASHSTVLEAIRALGLNGKAVRIGPKKRKGQLRNGWSGPNRTFGPDKVRSALPPLEPRALKFHDWRIFLKPDERCCAVADGTTVHELAATLMRMCTTFHNGSCQLKRYVTAPLYLAQFSTLSFATCLNSRSLFVTSVPLFSIVIEAMIRSFGPIGVPDFSSLARMVA